MWLSFSFDTRNLSHFHFQLTAAAAAATTIDKSVSLLQFLVAASGTRHLWWSLNKVNKLDFSVWFQFCY